MKDDENLTNSTNSTESKPARTLHIVPFSHVTDLMIAQQQNPDKDDVQGPATSGKNTVFLGSVNDILRSSVEEMQEGSLNRTFTFTDLKYFKLWYEALGADKKEKVKKLVKDGRLDLNSGSWMPFDEALTEIDGILDSF
jgi:hypothetical protein